MAELPGAREHVHCDRAHAKLAALTIVELERVMARLDERIGFACEHAHDRKPISIQLRSLMWELLKTKRAIQADGYEDASERVHC